MAQIKYRIEDIVCSGCAMDMENILLDMDGVDEASIDLKSGLFSVAYDPAEIDDKTITKKVKNLGFKTEIVTE